MSTPQTLPPPLEGSSSLKTTFRVTKHTLAPRRRFIGPMPASVLDSSLSPRPNTTKTPKSSLRLHRARNNGDSSSSSSSSDSDDEHIRDAIRAHALRYSQRHPRRNSKGKDSGDSHEWGENTEASVRHEMHKRWRESEWGQALHARRRRGSTATDRSTTVKHKKWIGTSFTIGEIPGLDGVPECFTPPDTPQPRIESPSPILDPPATSILGPMGEGLSAKPATSRTTTLETFVTAPSERPPSPPSSIKLSPPTAPSEPPKSTSSLLPASDRPASTRTGGLRPALKAGISNLIHSDTQVPILNKKNKGKGKSVHYVESPGPMNGPFDLSVPAPPDQVLARRGSTIADTSAGAVEEATEVDTVKWGEVFMQDRMVVRVSTSRQELVGGFDESRCRTVRGLVHDAWQEYQVVWKKDRLELYEDYDNPFKAFLMRHQRLAHVISLARSRTIVSLFSFADASISLTTSPSRPDQRAGLLHMEHGTVIFVFKHASRERSIQWFWELWKKLNGSLPPTLEVRVPALDISLRLDVPAHEHWTLVYNALSRSQVLEACEEALARVPNWRYLMDAAVQSGDGGFALAWRVNNILSWIPTPTSTPNSSKNTDEDAKWSVLWGLALRGIDGGAHLEFRRATHYATHLFLQSGSRINEPSALEGYLDRVRPHSQTHAAQYLSTHDGLLVFGSQPHAHPPAPPGSGSFLSRRSHKWTDATPFMHDEEVRRGAHQILSADGVLDMRSIVFVRRASAPQAPRRSMQPDAAAVGKMNDARARPPWEGADGTGDEAEEETPSDAEDAGGEEALAALTGDPAARSQIRVRRSVELVLQNGQVIRLEAHSRRLAIEWVTRLRALVAYWRQRHHIDAREEMDICGATKTRVTPHLHPSHSGHSKDSDDTGEAPPDPESVSLALGTLYHHCAIDGCRPITRSGKVFVRRGTRGPYTHVLLVLTAGHLVQFAYRGGAESSSNFLRRRKGQGRAVQLGRCAYVLSGVLAAQEALSQAEYDPNRVPLARRYADGLEADDKEEDTLFVVWYGPGAIGEGLDDSEIGEKGVKEKVQQQQPALSSKKKMLVFRTRSRLERDTWVWAINLEIERLISIQAVSQ